MAGFSKWVWHGTNQSGIKLPSSRGSCLFRRSSTTWLWLSRGCHSSPAWPLNPRTYFWPGFSRLPSAEIDCVPLHSFHSFSYWLYWELQYNQYNNSLQLVILGTALHNHILLLVLLGAAQYNHSLLLVILGAALCNHSLLLVILGAALCNHSLLLVILGAALFNHSLLLVILGAALSNHSLLMIILGATLYNQSFADYTGCCPVQSVFCWLYWELPCTLVHLFSVSNLPFEGDDLLTLLPEVNSNILIQNVHISHLP